MKKTTLLCSVVLASTMLAGCGTSGSSAAQIGTQVLSGVLTGQGTGGAITNVVQSVLGGIWKPTLKNLIGSWTYYQPGCAFTSEKLLAQAGGEVVAAQVKEKIRPTYEKLGVKASNTSVTFNENGTFSASFAGKSFSGTFTFDEATSKVTMKGLLLTINCYAKRNSNGIALLFESSKLLSLLQTVAALSGNTSIEAIGEVSKSYDGLRLGFDFK